MLQSGKRADTHKCPFYAGSYVRCRAVEEDSGGASYTERELAEEVRARRGLALLGQPLDGKSRTLYEVLSGMEGHLIVRPLLSKGLLGDDVLSLRGEGRDLLLEDLHEYVGRQTDLPKLRRVLLKHHASSCGVASTCRDGPELRQVEEKLGQLYEEVDLKVRLTPPTTEEKGQFAQRSGRIGIPRRPKTPRSWARSQWRGL